MTAYRFLCRKPGEGFATCYPALTAYMTPERAATLAEHWTGSDKWTAEECLPGSFDHPAQQKGR